MDQSEIWWILLFSILGKKLLLTLALIWLHVTLVTFRIACILITQCYVTCLASNGIITHKFNDLMHQNEKTT